VNKIRIKITYENQTINIALSEEFIISAWNAMKLNANRPISLPTTQAAIELHNGGGGQIEQNPH
jgi:ribosomal protein S10